METWFKCNGNLHKEPPNMTHPAPVQQVYQRDRTLRSLGQDWAPAQGRGKAIRLPNQCCPMYTQLISRFFLFGNWSALSSFVSLNCLNSQWLLFTFFLYNHSNKFYSKNCSNVHTYISTWYRGWHLKRQRWRGWRCYPLLIFFFFLSESPSYLLFLVVTEIIFIFRSRRTLTCLWRRTRPRSRRCWTSSLLSSSTEASEPPWVAGTFD